MSSEDNNEAVPPVVFNLVKTVTDAMAELTKRMSQLEAIQLRTLSAPPIPQPIPLGSHVETGGPSHVQNRSPLVDQQTAYQAALNGHTSPNGQNQHSRANPQPNPLPRAQREHNSIPNSPNFIRQHEFVDEFQDFEEEEMDHGGWRRENQWREQQRGFQPRRGREQEQDGLGKVKVRIPTFEGKCDPDAYMDWETKIEQIWTCHNFPEHRKVQLAALEFQGYAMVWWDTLVKDRRRNLDPDVATWAQMRALMRTRFIPAHHTRDLHQRLEI